MVQTQSSPGARRGWSTVLWLLSIRAVILMIWTALPPLTPLLVTAFVLADLSVLILQLRFGARVAAEFGGFAISWIIWLVLILLIGSTLITALNEIAKANTRPVAPIAEPLLLPVENGVAIFEGTIGFDSYNALQNTIEAAPDLRALRLTSDGGRIPAARGMAKLIKDNDLSTEADGTCASACTLVFIAGTHRTLREDARLGFHGYLLISGIKTLNTQEEEARDRAYYLAQGVEAEFLTRAFQTPPDQMWFPQNAELRAAGVLAGP